MNNLGFVRLGFMDLGLYGVAGLEGVDGDVWGTWGFTVYVYTQGIGFEVYTPPS